MFKLKNLYFDDFYFQMFKLNKICISIVHISESIVWSFVSQPLFV